MALAQEIIHAYWKMNDGQRVQFFEMLSRDFVPDQDALLRAATNYQAAPGPSTLAALSAAVESLRQELFRRINTASRGTETLVAMREHLSTSNDSENLAAIDNDLKHLFKSWFNRGFLHLERISWHTSALILEKLIDYESVHEINGWPDLRRRLEADRRCFAFFHPALVEEPIIFVEVALSNGLTGDLEPLLDIHAPVLAPEKADTAIFYSINNCLWGLRGVPFGNFLIKQVVSELASELPNIQTYSTLSPLPHFRGRCVISEMKTALRAIVYRVCWPILVPSLCKRHVAVTRSKLSSICSKNLWQIEMFSPSRLSASLLLMSPKRVRTENSTIL